MWPIQKGFVGGTVDSSTGLTHLGAREYDPGTGRFISVDPEFDANEPQSLGGYLYANNSPLSFSDPTGRGWGWAAVAVVAVVVVAVVVAVACPAVIPALISAGTAAAEAGAMAAASGAGVAATATTAAVAGAAELSIAGGAAVGAGVVGTGLTVAGAAGRIYAGTNDGPTVPSKPKTPPPAPRGPFRSDSQNAPGSQKGPAVTINQVKRALGQAGMRDVTGYDIEHVPHIMGDNGNPAYGVSPTQHGERRPGWSSRRDRTGRSDRVIGVPQTGKRGRPLIQISDKGLSSMRRR